MMTRRPTLALAAGLMALLPLATATATSIRQPSISDTFAARESKGDSCRSCSAEMLEAALQGRRPRSLEHAEAYARAQVCISEFETSLRHVVQDRGDEALQAAVDVVLTRKQMAPIMGAFLQFSGQRLEGPPPLEPTPASPPKQFNGIPLEFEARVKVNHVSGEDQTGTLYVETTGGKAASYRLMISKDTSFDLASLLEIRVLPSGLAVGERIKVWARDVGYESGGFAIAVECDRVTLLDQ